MKVSREAVEGTPCNLLGQIQDQMVDTYIAKQRHELAAVTDDYIAWMVYPPTPHDDPAEYAPYWIRLTDMLAQSPESG